MGQHAPELDNQLQQAAETYRRMLQLSGEHPQPNAGEVHLGLARVSYQWNDLEAAEQHAQQSLQLTRLYDQVIDRFIVTEVFLAQLTAAALAVLEPLRQQMEARGWADERLKATVLYAVALHLNGEQASAAHLLSEALALAEPGGFIRLFVDEGPLIRTFPALPSFC